MTKERKKKRIDDIVCSCFSFRTLSLSLSLTQRPILFIKKIPIKYRIVLSTTLQWKYYIRTFRICTKSDLSDKLYLFPISHWPYTYIKWRSEKCREEKEKKTNLNTHDTICMYIFCSDDNSIILYYICTFYICMWLEWNITLYLWSIA